MKKHIQINYPPSNQLNPGELDTLKKHEKALEESLIKITGRMYPKYRWELKTSVKTQRYFILRIDQTDRILYETGITNLENSTPEELITSIDYKEVFRASE